MFCSQCGSLLLDDVSACEVCGAPVTVSRPQVSMPTHTAAHRAQVQSFVASEQAYRTLVCPSCGQSALVVRADGAFADCGLCGSVVDVRTREVTVEHHEHVVNNITYENMTDRFILSGDASVLERMTASGAATLTMLDIPAGQGIQTVGDGFAFGSETLREAIIPEGVRHIGASAFCNCVNLEKLILPDSLDMIDSSAFENCKGLREVTIPSGVRLGENVFRGCDSLVAVAIGENVRGGQGAFIACSSLSEVAVDSGNSIADSMFANCPSLARVKLAEGVRTIEEYAFCDCTHLADIPLPTTLETIGGAAFRNCSALIRMTVPASVTNIGTNAFEGCTGLSDITLDGEPVLGDGVFKGCTRLGRMQMNEGVSSLSASTFEGCTALTTVAIPSSLKSIGTAVFKGCSSLKACLLPRSVERVAKEAFSGCASLECLCDHPIAVGPSAFQECGMILRAQIMGNVPSSAFCNCVDLESVIFAEGTSIIDAEAFGGCSSLRILDLPASLTEVRRCAFAGCTSLASVSFRSAAAPLIAQGAFAGCASLVSVAAPMAFFQSSTTEPLFVGASNIYEITIPDYRPEGVAAFDPELLGDKTVRVNGAELRWREWIMAYRAPVEPTVAVPVKKKGLFGGLLK